jgi:hypothetical protein
MKNVILIFGLVCTACATTPDQTAEPREEKVYKTGSNIPVGDRRGGPESTTIDPEAVRDAVSRSSRPLPPGVRP